MKKILLACIIMFSLKGYSQNADAIIGKWLKEPKEDLIIEVYKVGRIYNGKINRSEDKRKPVGFVMIENLKFNSKTKKWEGGKIHDPNSNQSFNANARLKSNGTLEVVGAMLFFKSKKTFTRVK